MKGATQALVFLLIVVAFLAVSVGIFKSFISPPPATQVTYNHFDFYRNRGSWEFDWQSGNKVYTVPLRFNPYEVENVPIKGSLNESFNRPQVFITFDPERGNFSVLALAASELSLNMVKALNVQPIAACTQNITDACVNRPIVTCEADDNRSVILLYDKEDAGILLKGDCIVLQGENIDLLKSIDRLLYQWYGVMN